LLQKLTVQYLHSLTKMKSNGSNFLVSLEVVPYKLHMHKLLLW